jgi:heme-degrading monooxygenase HmoA
VFARILRIQIDPGRIDAAAMLFEESVVPLCKNQKGFKGAQFLTDRSTGAGLILTFWKSEEDMQASERSRFFQDQVGKFISFFTAPPIRESFEVIYIDLK